MNFPEGERCRLQLPALCPPPCPQLALFSKFRMGGRSGKTFGSSEAREQRPRTRSKTILYHSLQEPPALSEAEILAGSSFPPLHQRSLRNPQPPEAVLRDSPCHVALSPKSTRLPPSTQLPLLFPKQRLNHLYRPSLGKAWRPDLGLPESPQGPQPEPLPGPQQPEHLW